MADAVIYARVSSAEQLREGFSTEAQLTYLREHARKEQTRIVAEFTDDESGSNSNRPGFVRMVEYLRAHPAVTTILAEKVDRLYRNFTDPQTLAKLGATVYFVKDGVTYGRDVSAREHLNHNLRLLLAENYLLNLSEEVKKGMRQKAAEGGFPTWAPLGYLNIKDPAEKKRCGGIAPDPAKADLVRELFEAAATGRHSLGALVRLAERIGLRGRYGHRLGKSVVVKVLTNMAYTGTFRWSGVEYRGKYAPLISPELYDRVQAALRAGTRPKSGTRHEYAFGGIARCGGCGGLLSGDRKKGRYVYYSCRCSRARGAFYPERQFDQTFAEVLRTLVLPAELRDRILADLDRWYSEATKKEAAQVTRARSRLEEIQTVSATAYEDKILGRISEVMWRDLSARWKDETARLRATIAAGLPNVERGVFMAAARAPFELAEVTANQYLAQNAHEKRRLVQICVSNCVVIDGNLSIHLRSPLDVVAKMATRPDWLATVAEFRTAILAGIAA